MKYNICTNFYANYLYRSLPQYYSLEKTSKDFIWWALCMDDETYEIIKKLKLKYARLIKLSDVETTQLLRVKKNRNKGEYSWTLKSFFIKYLFEEKKLNNVLYLDGDIFFFNDVKYVFEEIKNNSIAISPHRFPKVLKVLRIKEIRSGIFNAGVIYLKNDKEGRKALERWRRQCLNWCFWRRDDGKLGDQMYLNEWPKLYNNLLQFSHEGINLAPWNASEYKLSIQKNKLLVGTKPLIFYHFHRFKIYNDYSFQESIGFCIPKRIKQLIYYSYEQEVQKVIDKIHIVDPNFHQGLDNKKTIWDLGRKVLDNIYSW